MEIELNDQNFDEEIQKAEKPVLADFWASWCAPCNMLTPILEKLANEYKDKLILAKVNLDEAKLVSQKFKIDRIPTVVLFKKGKPVSGFMGVRREEDIKEWLEKFLGEESQKKEDEIEKPKEEEIEAKSETNKEIQDIIKWYEGYAEKKGIKLNPDRKVVEGLMKGLLENEKKYGARYCPCRRVTEDFQEDRDKICPCKWYEGEIERDGHCYCNLFYKK
jgi:thioredoxin